MIYSCYNSRRTANQTNDIRFDRETQSGTDFRCCPSLGNKNALAFFKIKVLGILYWPSTVWPAVCRVGKVTDGNPSAGVSLLALYKHHWPTTCQ